MVELQPVDAVEVTLVVDNFVDVLLAGAEGVRRFPLAYDAFDGDQLVAEHGFSALVTIFVGGFHLTGAVFEPVIEPTIAVVTDLGVERLMPGHCTGWKATHRLAQALPRRVRPAVGRHGAAVLSPVRPLRGVPGWPATGPGRRPRRR
jgi:metal-dependent hydrolase (beta-lactamase superfamily II)